MNNVERDHYLQLLGITQWQRRDDARFVQDASQPLASTASIGVETSSAEGKEAPTLSPVGAESKIHSPLDKAQTDKAQTDKAQIDRSKTDQVPAHQSPLKPTASESFILQGEGNPNANCIVLGEIAVSDVTEDAFVKQEKLLLNNMLQAIDLQLDDVFTVRPLECLASALRDPQETELQICYQYLEHHINTIQPNVVLVMHQLTAQVLLRTESTLTQLRDQSHQFGQSKIIVTFPPAHLLKRPADKTKAWHDLKQLKSILDLC